MTCQIAAPNYVKIFVQNIL